MLDKTIIFQKSFGDKYKFHGMQCQKSVFYLLFCLTPDHSQSAASCDGVRS